MQSVFIHCLRYSFPHTYTHAHNTQSLSLWLSVQCIIYSSFHTIYQNDILAGINDGGGHLGSSSQSSSRESKLAALPSDEKPDGDKLSGG